jgi:protein disulfide-isomerase/thiol:disulfide interchange protein DsbC
MKALLSLLILFSFLFAQDLYQGFVKEQVKQIPLKNAIVFGRGRTELITFMNPDCGHCRREWQELKNVPDKVKVYIFLVPFKGNEESRSKEDYIACSKEPIKALDEVLSGKFDGKPPKVPRCPLVDEHIRLAESLNVSGTPYNIILKDYKVIEGYNPELLKIIGVRK